MNQTVTNAGKPKTSRMAVTSMVMGILSIFIGWLTLAILPIIAIILGHKAQGKIKRSGGTLTGTGAAVAGYVTGYISLGLLIPMLGIIAAITIPAYQDYTMRARTAEAHYTTAVHKTAIAEALATGAEPGTISMDPSDLGLMAPDQYRTTYVDNIAYDSNGVITLSFRNQSMPYSLAGKTIVYVPDLIDGKVKWRIDRERSTVPYRFLRRLQ